MAVPRHSRSRPCSSTLVIQLSSIGVENEESARRNLREMLFTSPGIENSISGVILFEETLYQDANDGTSFVKMLQSKNIIPGIKVDKGVIALPGTEGETETQGIDDLGKRYGNFVLFLAGLIPTEPSGADSIVFITRNACRCAKYYEQGARFAKVR
jgi:fructose-bisphosphate aldolase class 1